MFWGALLPVATFLPGQQVVAAQCSEFQVGLLNFANDVSNGKILTGIQIPEMPKDMPDAAGTAVPNTLWVDTYYSPKKWFITENRTWRVCASGCAYANPLDAWNAALTANYLNDAVLTISIADGTYAITNQLITTAQKTKFVQIVGNKTKSPFGNSRMSVSA